MDNDVFRNPLYQMAGRDVMSDDDDLFEREMVSLGLGSDSSAVRDREDDLFTEALDASTGQEKSSSPTEATSVSRPPAQGSETQDEAARIFEEAMGSLWQGEEQEVAAPEKIEVIIKPEPVDTRRWPRMDVESDTEAGRIFEEALGELTSVPRKEVDEALQPKTTDLWAESNEVLSRMIRRGKLRHDSELDLHGMTQREARAALESYLVHSCTGPTRLVRVVCGRGLHSRAGSVLLRDTLPTWLQVDLQEWVERSFRAPREQGGEGAWYVILRRS